MNMLLCTRKDHTSKSSLMTRFFLANTNQVLRTVLQCNWKEASCRGPEARETLVGGRGSGVRTEVRISILQCLLDVIIALLISLAAGVIHVMLQDASCFQNLSRLCQTYSWCAAHSLNSEECQMALQARAAQGGYSRCARRRIKNRRKMISPSR